MSEQMKTPEEIKAFCLHGSILIEDMLMELEKTCNSTNKEMLIKIASLEACQDIYESVITYIGIGEL